MGRVTKWDPAHYERFQDQRLQPGRDLIARIEHPAPAAIADLGCGTGRLTEELAARWPAASVVGVDRSPEMLPGPSDRVTYELGDIEAWEPPAPLDLIYANASLQWLADHPALFPRLVRMLAPGGVLAVQMPMSWDQPSHRILRSVGADYGVEALPPPTLEPVAYYDVLAPHVDTEQVWVTTYYHELHGDNPVYQWVSATGMQRFLKRIDPGRHDEYRRRCAEEIRAAYPPGDRGTTVFPFTRLFVLAARP